MQLTISDIITTLKSGLILIGSVLPSYIYRSSSRHDTTLVRIYSTTTWNVILATGIEQHLTLPTDLGLVFISSNRDITKDHYYSRLGDSTVRAIIPNENSLDGVGADINQNSYLIANNTTISFISDKNMILSLAFYKE